MGPGRLAQAVLMLGLAAAPVAQAGDVKMSALGLAASPRLPLAPLSLADIAPPDPTRAPDGALSAGALSAPIPDLPATDLAALADKGIWADADAPRRPTAPEAAATSAEPRSEILRALYPSAGPALFFGAVAEAPSVPARPRLSPAAREAISLATRALNAELAGKSAEDMLQSRAEKLSTREQNRLVKAAAQAVEDHPGLGLKSLDYTFTPRPQDAPDWSVQAIRPLDGGTGTRNATFLQLGAARSAATGMTWNAGLVHREILPGGTWMLGGNLFYDYASRYGHRRAGFGFDAMTAGFRLSANRYVARTGWRPGRPAYEERALSGQDVEIAGRLPGLRQVQISGKAWHFHTEEGPDQHGDEIALEYRPSGVMTLRVSSRDKGDATRETVASMQLTYRLGVPLADQSALPAPGRGALADRLYEKVHRENAMRVEERLIDIIAPAGYAIAFAEPQIDAANVDAVTLVLSAAEVGTRYAFEVFNTAAPQSRLVGAGQVVEDTMRLPPLDLRTLADGEIEVRIVLTDRAGNTGIAAVARGQKETPAPAGATLTADAPAVNMANQAAFSFEIDTSPAWTRFAYRVRQEDGTVTAATGTGRIENGVLRVDDIDLAGLPDGTLSVEVELAGDGPAGTNALLTFKVVKDVVAPRVTAIEPLEVARNVGA